MYIIHNTYRHAEYYNTIEEAEKVAAEELDPGDIIIIAKVEKALQAERTPVRTVDVAELEDKFKCIENKE